MHEFVSMKHLVLSELVTPLSISCLFSCRKSDIHANDIRSLLSVAILISVASLVLTSERISQCHKPTMVVIAD